MHLVQNYSRLFINVNRWQKGSCIGVFIKPAGRAEKKWRWKHWQTLADTDTTLGRIDWRGLSYGLKLHPRFQVQEMVLMLPDLIQLWQTKLMHENFLWHYNDKIQAWFKYDNFTQSAQNYFKHFKSFYMLQCFSSLKVPSPSLLQLFSK